MSDPPPSSNAHSAEDRRAAAALSSIEDQGDLSNSNTNPSSTTQATNGASSKPSIAKGDKTIDLSSLSDAVKRLETLSSNNSAVAKPSTEANNAIGSTKSGASSTQPSQPVVKIDNAHVQFLQEHCLVSKSRATELLKSHEGDLKTSLRVWMGIEV